MFPARARSVKLRGADSITTFESIDRAERQRIDPLSSSRARLGCVRRPDERAGMRAPARAKPAGRPRSGAAPRFSAAREKPQKI
ncbi:MAG TPA: hypothetical protein VEC18_05990 [Myxococcota bacterium]|nr:hypothetical protein [Myxococcota bacterium]